MRVFLPAVVLFFVAVLTHGMTLSAVPGVIMNKAMTAMEDAGVPLHGFRLAPRATPENQTVVRPSPDIAYSICRFDLSDGPVVVQGTPWDGYASLNIYDAQTDNILGIDLGPEQPTSIGVILHLARHEVDTSRQDLKTFTLDQPKGLALIRRLAPSDEAHELARLASADDICQPL